MAEAARVTPYEQEYLSLLARRGELQAEKIGRNWYTTVEWLNNYLREKRPSDLIELPEETKGGASRESILKREKSTFQIVMAWVIFTILAVSIGAFVFDSISKRLDGIEEKTDTNKIIPEEIIKVPNENGGYDTYGRVKMNVPN